jgi:hypothetical protein
MNVPCRYIAQTLGAEFLLAVALDLDEVVKEGHAGAPVVFILSAGDDPTAAIENITKKFKHRLRSVSLGQVSIKKETLMLGWSTVLVTALGSWEKPVPCGQA